MREGKLSHAPRRKLHTTTEKPLSTYVVVKSTYVDHRIYVHRLYDHVRGRRIRRSVDSFSLAGWQEVLCLSALV